MAAKPITITLSTSVMERLDRERGIIPRSTWIANKLNTPKISVLCPRCGRILDPDDVGRSLGHDGISFYCYDCDMETHSGVNNPEEKTKYGFRVTRYKGDLILNSEDVKKYFLWLINNK